MFLIAVGQEVNDLENSVVVQELEFENKLVSYGFLWSLGNQYNTGTMSWFSLAFTSNFRVV